MAIKNHDKFYSGLNSSGNPNQVSRNLKTGDRSYSQVVYQSGKPILDSELNLSENITSYVRKLIGRNQTQSGFLRGLTFKDGYSDFVYTFPTQTQGGYTNNRFHMKKMTALVAGEPVVIEYTNIETPGYNTIILQEPQIYDGTNSTIKRTDFVFLEVWKTLVAPSVKASTTLVIDTSVDALTEGVDKVTILGSDFNCVAVGNGYPSVANSTDWEIGANDIITAGNIVNAINNQSGFSITADNNGKNIVTLTAIVPGSNGNTTSISVVSTNAQALVLSGLFSGGEDRLNKPAQNKIYRHGNVQSDSSSWLWDQLTDPVIDTESTQRVQVQYRIRVTGTDEGVNHKMHPDGFTTPRNIAGPTGQINAQGSQASPVDLYPFVPADGTSNRDNSSANAYEIVDSGLFIAGDGSEASAQALGTIDGYVYAIPICFVFRKNNASDSQSVKGFDPINNTNGGPMSNHTGFTGPIGTIGAGYSDRPDKGYCDVITGTDILDLRRNISFEGVDLKAELQYQMQSLLDGNFKSWAIDATSKNTLGGSSGDVSTQFLVCNEIGREEPEGVAPFSGDTNRGTTERSFDHLARRFGDQPVVERVVFAFTPGDRDTTNAPAVGDGQVNDGKYVSKTGASTTRWCVGDKLHIDLSSFDSSSSGYIFDGKSWVSSASSIADPSSAFFAPNGMVITDVISIKHDDGHYDTPTNQDCQASQIYGLGTQHIEIHLDNNDQLVSGGQVVDGANPEYKMVSDASATDGSPRRIFVELEISYPLGVGLSDTPDLTLTPEPAVYPYGAMVECGGVRPSDMENPLPPLFRGGYREVALEYIASDNGAGTPIGGDALNHEYIVSSNQDTLHFPRRVYRDKYQGLTVSDAVSTSAMPVDEANCAFGSSEREIKLATPLSGGGHTLCQITYYSQDPIPNYGASGGGYQIAVYYRSNAPQTCGVKEGDINGPAGGGLLPTTLVVEPLIVDTNLWTGQVGMGSVEGAFPYLTPLDQIAVNDGSNLDQPTMTAGMTKEWYFCATSQIEIDDFNSNSGLLALHSFIQADRTEFLTLGGTNNTEKPRKDMEFRAYYPFADDTTYRPTIMSQPLSGAVRHKVFIPMLVRATEDAKGNTGGILYRKNELLLVVFSRFAELDSDNTVKFLANGRTCAAVYKTKNLLLLVGE